MCVCVCVCEYVYHANVYRGGQIQTKPFYSQSVLLATELRVSYSLSLICLQTSEDVENKILSLSDWRDWCKVLMLLHSVPDLQEAIGLLVQTHQISLQYNTNLLSLCREICFEARHLHKNIQYNSQ